MRIVYLVSVWTHVVAATAWLGGMLFLVFVVVPVMRRPDVQRAAPDLLDWMSAQYHRLGWIALGVLFVTGLLNLWYRGMPPTMLLEASSYANPYVHIVAGKLAVFFLMVGLQAWHDFAIGPPAMEAWRRNPGGPEALRLRRLARWIGRVIFVLSLVLVAFGVVLVRGT